MKYNKYLKSDYDNCLLNKLLNLKKYNEVTLYSIFSIIYKENSFLNNIKGILLIDML